MTPLEPSNNSSATADLAHCSNLGTDQRSALKGKTSTFLGSFSRKENSSFCSILWHPYFIGILGKAFLALKFFFFFLFFPFQKNAIMLEVQLVKIQDEAKDFMCRCNRRTLNCIVRARVVESFSFPIYIQIMYILDMYELLNTGCDLVKFRFGHIQINTC